MADWTWEADARGRFTRIAEQAREFGIDPTRLLSLDRLTAQDSEDEVEARQPMITRQLPFRDLLCRYDWEGFPLIFMLSGVPVHDADGAFRGFRGGARDITSAHELAHRAPVARDAGWCAAPPPSDPACQAESGLRQLDILVVEDDAVNRLVIQGFLAPHGHTVVFAVDGEQGVAAARARRHDVVLMDVMMPGIDGPAATRLIRALPPPLCEVPIIALTANAMRGDRERYLAEGMNLYVTKPIDRPALYAAIEQAVGGRAFGVIATATRAATVTNPERTAMLDALTDSLDL